MAKKIVCPSLFCDGIGIPVAQKKNFSVGKAVVGNTIGFAVGGIAGGLVGIATGFNGKKKVTFVCQKCGRTWTQKV